MFFSFNYLTRVSFLAAWALVSTSVFAQAPIDPKLPDGFYTGVPTLTKNF